MVFGACLWFGYINAVVVVTLWFCCLVRVLPGSVLFGLFGRLLVLVWVFALALAVGFVLLWFCGLVGVCVGWWLVACVWM